MFGRANLSWIGLIAIFVLVGVGIPASAGPIEDAPEALSDSLGISTTAAEMVLASCVLLSVGLVLSVMEGSNMALTVIVLLAFTGMLTAIGWLDGWLIIMVVLVIALIFGARLRDWGDQKFSKE